MKVAREGAHHREEEADMNSASRSTAVFVKTLPRGTACGSSTRRSAVKSSFNAPHAEFAEKLASACREIRRHTLLCGRHDVRPGEFRRKVHRDRTAAAAPHLEARLFRRMGVPTLVGASRGGGLPAWPYAPPLHQLDARGRGVSWKNEKDKVRARAYDLR